MKLSKKDATGSYLSKDGRYRITREGAGYVAYDTRTGERTGEGRTLRACKADIEERRRLAFNARCAADNEAARRAGTSPLPWVEMGDTYWSWERYMSS